MAGSPQHRVRFGSMKEGTLFAKSIVALGIYYLG